MRSGTRWASFSRSCLESVRGDIFKCGSKALALNSVVRHKLNVEILTRGHHLYPIEGVAVAGDDRAGGVYPISYHDKVSTVLTPATLTRCNQFQPVSTSFN